MGGSKVVGGSCERGMGCLSDKAKRDELVASRDGEWAWIA